MIRGALRFPFSLVVLLLLSFLPSAAQDSRTVNEPAFPTSCAVLAATQATSSGEPASETSFDTARIQAALSACPSGQAVELTTAGTNNAFLIAPIDIPNGVTLVVDAGVTVYASRNPADYQSSANGAETCGTVGTTGNGCKPLITVNGGNASSGSGLMGFGVINGRGGDKLLLNGVTSTSSWWDLANQANSAGKAQNNPILLYATQASNFTLYKITLTNSPMFHVKYQNASGFTVWGVKIVAPYSARNTDGIDPGDNVSNVTITNSFLSDGDDMVAIGASGTGKPASNITVSNTHTYSGHGISIGSYTSSGVSNVLVSGVNMAGNLSDTNSGGLKIKSASDRGGLVSNVTYQNVCVQNTRYALQLNPNYNTNTGTLIPTFENITYHNVTVQNAGATAMQLQLQGKDANHLTSVQWDNLNILNSFNTAPAAQFATITLGPGPVNPTVLQQLSGNGISYQGNITNPGEARLNCPTGNFPFLAGELFLSTPASTNQQTLSLPNPATFTLNAVVEPVESASVTPTSSITFYEGTRAVGTAALSGNGTVASLTLTGVSPGTHTYTAQYPADSNYAALSFGSVIVSVNTTPTVTTLASSTNSSAYGTPVTLTATVTATTGTPTGTVTFRSGNTVLGTGSVNSSGVATLTTSALPVGTDNLTANYGGSTNYSKSDSSATPVSVTVTQAASTTTVTASPANATYGANVTLTATVTSSASGSPTGNVTFMDGSTVVGTAILGSSTGTATLRTKTLSVGTHNITAVYAGDANFTTSTSASAATVNIFTASSYTTIGFSGSNVPFGTNVTMIAIINGGTSTATGTVTFKSGGVVLGTSTIDAATGSATFSVSTLTLGQHNINAVYSGDSNYTGSTSATTPLVITQASTTIAVTATSTTPTYGANDTFTATVTIPQNTTGTPTGTVNFYDGTTLLASGVMLSGTGTASITTSALSGGAHTITATYSGDTNYATSTSPALTVTVGQAATTTTLAAPAPVTYGSAATLSASITSTVSGTPTGSVSFYDGATLLGTAPLSSGTATFTTGASLTGGAHSLTAVYAGDTNYATSTSGAQTLTVNKAPVASFTFSTTPSTSTYGGNVTISTNLAAVAATPTGSLTFFDGSTSLGTVTLASGTASFSTSSFTAGTRTLSFTYSGDGNYQAITTIPSNRQIAFVVSQATGTATLNATPATVTYGSPVSLTTTVPTAATGTVTFFDGATSLGTSAITNGSASLSVSTLTGGTHSLTAKYNGDTNFTSAVSSAVQVTVNPLTTTTTLAANPTTLSYGSSTTLSVTVAPTSATGTVTFLDGSTSLGTATLSNGTASFSTSALAGGAHTLTAVYSGDTNDAGSTSDAVTVTVNKAATSLAVAFSPSAPVYGSPVIFTATLTPSAASGTVSFTDGATTLGAASLNNGVATFTTSTLGGGSHSITASYAGTASYAASTSSTLGVVISVAPSTATLAVNPTSSAFPGATTLTATISPTAGTGTVQFRDNGILLGSSAVSNGSASLPVSGLGGGAHNFTATYSGDNNVGGSTSNSVSFAVAPGAVPLALTTSSATTTYGQNLTLTASFTPATAVNPTGTITFLDGTTALTTIPVSGNAVTYSLSTLTPGSHSLTASYSGDANYAAATTTATTVTIAQGNSTLTLTSTPPEATPNQSFTLTATVAPVATGDATPTGTMTFADAGGPIATAALNNGVATLSRSLSALGSHSYTATYSGDTDYTSATASIAVNIKQLGTTLSITGVPTSGSYGSTSFAFTAQLTPANGGPTPTGTITFTNTSVSPSVVLGTVTLGSTPSAAISGISLPGGTSNIVATYGGDTTYTASDTTAAPAVITVAAASTTTTLNSSATTVSYGTVVTLTASVNNTVNATGAGNVSFYDGTSLLATVAVNASGVATLALPSTLSVATHSFTASYAGTTNLAASSSTPLSVVVNPLTQTISFSGVPASVTYGVTPFAVSVSASSNLAVSLSASGPATLTGSTLQITGAGTVTLTATQPGNSTYAAATPATATITVAKAPLTVAVNNVTIAYGASIPTLTGSVTGQVNGDVIGAAYTTTATSSSLPGNYVISAALSDPGSRLANYAVTNPGGTLTISANTQTITFPAPPASVTYGVSPITLAATSNSNLPITYTVTGPATVSGSTLTVTGAGPIVVTATQPGNSIYGAATPVSQTILSAKAALSVTANDATRAFGAANPAFTGTLTGVVNRDAITATYTTTATASSAPGTYPITPALTDPNGRLVNYSVTPTPATLTVTTSSTAIAVTPSVTTASFGSAVTFTTSFASNSGGSPTGTVTFKDGGTTLGTATLNAGVATLTTSSLSVGAHSISVSYAGDTNFTGVASTTTANVTITQAASTTTLNATPANASYGASVTLTATITNATTTTATGTVTFKDGTTTLGTGTLSNGIAAYTTSSLAGGTHNLTAVYAGDTNFLTSTSAPEAVTIAGAATTTALQATPTTAALGNSVALSATITSAITGTLTGTVTFSDGSTVLGTGTLNASGIATYTVSSLAVGTHAITASYAGDANYAASTSAATTVRITTAAVTPAVSVTPATTTFGGSLTFTVTLPTALKPAPTGTVTLKAGTITLGTGTLSATSSGSSATITVNTATVPVAAGSYNAVAYYAGDTNFAAADSSASPAAFTVTPAGTATTLSLSATQILANSTPGVTLTATVSSTAGVPAGTVTFLNGSTSLGTGMLNSNGVATLTLTTLAPGTDNITASYAAAGNFATSTSAAMQLVVVAPVALSLSPSSLSLAAAASGNSTLTITPAMNYTGAVTLACSSPVSYLTCTVSSAPNITGTSPVTATVTVSVAATYGALSTPRLNGEQLGRVAWAMLLPLVGLVGMRRRLGSAGRLTLMGLLLLGAATTLTGCGGSASSASHLPPAGAQNVTITATANGTAVTSTLAINITN